MNLIDRTLKDSAWYWAPAQATGADGVPVFSPAVLFEPPNGGRWDDNPSTAVGPQGETIQINAQFTTRQVIVSGGWLLKKGTEGDKDPSSLNPSSFPQAREIYSVGGAQNLKRDLTYYMGKLK